MQRFSLDDARYAYSAAHASIGTVAPGERFEVECVEGFGETFASAADFSRETYAAAEALKWAVTGPISLAGARAGEAIAITIHSVEVVTPGVVVYGSYTDPDPLAWWDDETACEVYPAEGGSLRFDERTTLATDPLIGCLATAPREGEPHAKLQGTYGGNMDCRQIRAGATLVLPVEHDGAGIYFGDCKALMGDGEIVNPPEVGAVVTASAHSRSRPASMTWPRIETDEQLIALVSGTPLEWCARQAYRELLEWVVEDTDLPRPQASLLLGMVAHTGICQISNTDFTASCAMPRAVLAPYLR
ncbi:MAG TPA: acetamidase/formamidase family protein [Gaiellales bacterium]|jgi:acetamidase/formamidase